MSNRPTDTKRFSVEYPDENASARHTEEIDPEQFSEGAKKRARLYAAILNRVSAPARKIHEAGEEQLLQLLQKGIEELFILHRRFGAIDTHPTAVTVPGTGRAAATQSQLQRAPPSLRQRAIRPPAARYPDRTCTATVYRGLVATRVS